MLYCFSCISIAQYKYINMYIYIYIYIYIYMYPPVSRATRLRSEGWKSKSRSPLILQFLVLLFWMSAASSRSAGGVSAVGMHSSCW